VRGKKGKTLQEVTRLGKDRKVFQIWLEQCSAWKGKKGIGKEAS